MRSDSSSAPALPPHARFFTRAHCSLCDRASVILARLEAEGLLSVERVDIGTDPALDARYGHRIPVVELSSGQHVEGRISEYRLRRALAERAGP